MSYARGGPVLNIGNKKDKIPTSWCSWSYGKTYIFKLYVNIEWVVW